MAVTIERSCKAKERVAVLNYIGAYMELFGIGPFVCRPLIIDFGLLRWRRVCNSIFWKDRNMPFDATRLFKYNDRQDIVLSEIVGASNYC